MSNSRIHQAVAAALALGAAAGAAHAIDITGVASGSVLYISGSTAIDPGLTSYWVTGTTAVCAGAGSDATFYTGTLANKKFVAVACTSNSTIGGGAIAVIKEDNGGSQFGIDPVRDNSALPNTPISGTVPNFFPDYTTLTSSLCGATSNPIVLACTGAYGTSAVHPNLGFSDVDPPAFQDSRGTATQFNSLDVIFAANVNVGLYHELQTAQGLSVGDDGPGNMPKLNQALINVLLTRQVTNWTTVLPQIGTTAVIWGASGGTQFGGGAATNPSSTNVFVCQRGQSSGTERTAEIFLEAQNCAINITPFAAAVPASCVTDGCTWSTSFNNDGNFAGAGTGDVLSCLQGQDKLGHLAIGFASIDNPWGTFQSNTARRDFRYIRYNDAVPSIETVAADNYRWWAQSVGISPAATNGNAVSGVAGNIASYHTTGVGRIGSTPSIADLNSRLVYAAGWDAGFLAIPDGVAAIPNPATAALATFEGNPVNSVTRFGSGTVTNNCQPAATSQFVPNVAADEPTWLSPALF